MRQSIELESVPTVLHIPKGYNDRIICGMTDGRVVLFKVANVASAFNEETLIDQNENSGAVTTIDSFDLTGDGKLELIVGRRDGTVQVFSLPSEENAFDTIVRQIYSEVTQAQCVFRSKAAAFSKHFVPTYSRSCIEFQRKHFIGTRWLYRLQWPQRDCCVHIYGPRVRPDIKSAEEEPERCSP